MRRKAQRVKLLLQDPDLIEAFGEAETWLKDQWAVEPDASKREELFRQLQGLRLVAAMLQKTVADAAIESRKAEKQGE